LKESNPRLVIFVDEKYCSAIDLAKAIIRDAKQPKQIEEESIDITTDDYLKLSFLYDGNFSDPTIKANKEQYIRLHKDLVN